MLAVPPDNKEKLLLYLSVSVSAGLLSLLALVIGRLLWQRRKQQVAAASTTLPSFADDLSEVDTDIDLTAPATITVLASSLSPGEVSNKKNIRRLTSFIPFLLGGATSSCGYAP